MIDAPSSIWAIQDVDARNRPGQHLREPLWKDRRMALYFDWHVGFVAVNDFASGPPQ